MQKDLNPRMQETERIQHCGWPKCGAACCIYGAWIELPLVAEILENADVISACLPPRSQNPGAWFSELIEEDPHVPGGKVQHTMTLPTPDHYGEQACVFLRTDAKCALQVWGTERGEHAWRYKPFYCILHPLMLDEAGRITLDTVAEMVDETGSCVRHSETSAMLEELYKEEIEFIQENFREK